MKASIIVPVFNRSGLTVHCLRTILADPPTVGFEIIVVDDASTDDTPVALEAFGGAVEAIRNEVNGGFAAACNRGAAAAGGDYVVFLNNDTEPTPGWLDALVRYAELRPRVAVVGSQLRFPNDAVQHAGVVFCQDGQPRHLYAGLPASLPAVGRSRPFQAVTAASCLIRRDAFAEAGGFDEAFRNGMEDVDLCLRLGQRGHEVHYCHESVVYHLESASRGRTSPEIRDGARLFARRWGGRVRRDDLDYYLEDGLLEIGYSDGYPLRMEVAPSLATLSLEGRAGELEWALASRSRQVIDLLRDVTVLSARLVSAEASLPVPGPVPGEGGGSTDPGPVRDRSRPGGGQGDKVLPELVRLSRTLADLEADVHRVQLRLASRRGQGTTTGSEAAVALPTPYLAWTALVRRVREVVQEHVPEGAVVAVVSHGEEELVRIPGRTGWHFPRAPGGGYAGHYPVDGAAALEHLEDLRASGAGYLVVPATAVWWLDHYADFGRHVRGSCRTVAWDPELGLVAALASPSARDIPSDRAGPGRGRAYSDEGR